MDEQSIRAVVAALAAMGYFECDCEGCQENAVQTLLAVMRPLALAA